MRAGRSKQIRREGLWPARCLEHTAGRSRRIYHVSRMPKKKFKLGSLLRPHWPMLILAFVAVLGETATDLLEPWPLKIVFDHIFGTKKLPHWLSGFLSSTFGIDKFGILHFAAAPVTVI